ncbi:MAG: hypothetical protein JRN67_13810 [Nitrososphaerota archaeon]|nr:hypothetical protein [Nitrososphaerota archaeon]
MIKANVGRGPASDFKLEAFEQLEGNADLPSSRVRVGLDSWSNLSEPRQSRTKYRIEDMTKLELGGEPVLVDDKNRILWHAHDEPFYSAGYKFKFESNSYGFSENEQIIERAVSNSYAINIIVLKCHDKVLSDRYYSKLAKTWLEESIKHQAIDWKNGSKLLVSPWRTFGSAIVDPELTSKILKVLRPDFKIGRGINN